MKVIIENPAITAYCWYMTDLGMSYSGLSCPLDLKTNPQYYLLVTLTNTPLEPDSGYSLLIWGGNIAPRHGIGKNR